MLKKSDILSRHEEVTKVIDWYIRSSSARYRLVMTKLAGVDEFHSNVWLRMLSTITDDAEISAGLSVVVVRACCWELHGLANRPPQDLLDYPDRRCEFQKSTVAAAYDDSFDVHESLTDLMFRLRRVAPDRVYGILCRVAGLDGKTHTLDAIGAEFGITKQRVQQLVSRMAERLDTAGNKQQQKIKETAWRERLGKSASGRILLQEFDKDRPVEAV